MKHNSSVELFQVSRAPESKVEVVQLTLAVVFGKEGIFLANRTGDGGQTRV